MTLLRNPVTVQVWLRQREGISRLQAEDGVPITVAHHCEGIVARAYTGHSGGFTTANAMAAAVRGKLRGGVAPLGAIMLWTAQTGDGHAAIVTRAGDQDSAQITCNVGDTIQQVAASSYAGLNYEGWVWPWDVPGFGSKPKGFSTSLATTEWGQLLASVAARIAAALNWSGRDQTQGL